MIQRCNKEILGESTFLVTLPVLELACLFHMPKIQADLSRLVASHELQNETRARPLAMYPPPKLQCKMPTSHLGSSLHPPLGLNADLLTFKAVFVSDLRLRSQTWW